MYQRKTRDEWQLWVDYGQGFEHETSEDTRRAAIEQQKCYRDNCPEYRTKIKLARVRAEVTP